MIPARDAGSWDARDVFGPDLFKHGGTWDMPYTGSTSSTTAGGSVNGLG